MPYFPIQHQQVSSQWKATETYPEVPREGQFAHRQDHKGRECQQWRSSSSKIEGASAKGGQADIPSQRRSSTRINSLKNNNQQIILGLTYILKWVILWFAYWSESTISLTSWVDLLGRLCTNVEDRVDAVSKYMASLLHHSSAFGPLESFPIITHIEYEYIVAVFDPCFQDPCFSQQHHVSLSFY